jgi:phage N-6-adenine-methyltransferase
LYPIGHGQRVAVEEVDNPNTNGARMTELIRYEAACRALYEAKSVDEVKDMRDKASALKAYARQAKNRQLEIDAAEIRMRAERRIGELMEYQRKTVGMNRGANGSVVSGSERDPVKDDRPTLADAGIDKHLADRARKMAAVPEEKFEAALGEWREKVQEETARVTSSLLDMGSKPHVTNNSGDNEWYTPSEFLTAARKVMGGIDLDPASSPVANARVGASVFYTEKEDGLSKTWAGRVWMNPPYSNGLMAPFMEKLSVHVADGSVSQAVVLVNNATETKWFQSAAKHAKLICFPEGRIQFLKPDGERGPPLQGQAILYFGPKAETYNAVFSQFGLVVRV